MASNFLDSTIAQILEDIISQISFEGESHSNIADILLSILNQTPYDEEPKSVIADLFLKLKAKIEDEPFVPDDKEYTSNIAKILVSILNETEYTEEPKSRIAELLLELKEELESFIEVTVSGSVVSFNTKVSEPLVNLTADINPTETGSGAKSPSNPYVIGGHTGINVTNANKAIVSDIYTIEPIQAGTGNPSPTNKRHLSYGLSLVRDDDSVLNIWGGDLNIKTGELISRFEEHIFTGTQTWNYSSVYKSYYAAYPGLNMIKYGLENSFIGYAECFVPYDGTSWPSKSGECCIGYINANTNGFRVSFYASEVSDVNTLVQGTQVIYESATPTTIQLSATELERAKATLGITTYTEDFGQTVYGGSLNVTTGVLTIDKGYKDLGTLSWTMSDSVFVGTFPDNLPKAATSAYSVPNAICSHYDVSSISAIANNKFTISTGQKVWVMDSNYSDATTFAAGVSGVQLVYPLDQPIVIQLDPIEIRTMLGSNNLYHDCNGDTTVTYLDKRF